MRKSGRHGWLCQKFKVIPKLPYQLVEEHQAETEETFFSSITRIWCE
jgi:hypothetical protein